MVITRPMLPQKDGYVEVDIDGRRTYRNIETGILIDDEVPVPTIPERVSDLETDVDQIITGLEAMSV